MRITHAMAALPRALIVATAVLGATLIAAVPAHAQAPATLDVEGLKTPAAPAFALLGVAPTTIERPTTPQGLAVNLLTSAAKSTDLIPRDYALEVAPYWLRSRPALTYQSYFAPGVAQSIAQTFSVSLVTSKPTDGSPAGTTDLGFGVRTSVRSGHASGKVRELLKTLAKNQVRWHLLTLVLESLEPAAAAPPPLPAGVQQVLGAQIKKSELSAQEIAAVVDDMRKWLTRTWAGATDRQREPVRLVLEALEFLSTSAPTDPAEAKQWQARRAAVIAQLQTTPAALDNADAAAKIRAELATVEASFGSVSREIQVQDQIRRGVIITLAGAVASRVAADGGLRDAELRQHGGWATFAYRTDGPLLDFIALARVIARAEEVGSDVFDFGVQFVHQPGALLWSAEYVQRIEEDDDVTTQRLAVNAEYKVRDNMYLTAAFGKDFANPSIGKPKGGLVSVLGLSFGFSGKSKVVVSQP